jgi:uncharacterized protein YdeI (YjbR/CyaY-like superfamily)
MTEAILRRHFLNRENWRAWLEVNHASANELWLILYKKHTKKSSIRLDEAVEEALCFGWIDGKLRRIDDEKHEIRFTPRKMGSTWSETNINRVKRLIKEDRMTSVGLKKYRDGMRDPRMKLLRKDFEIPQFIVAALKRNKRAWDAFDKLAPSRKQQIVWWIATAKREETREKRIKETIRRSLTGKFTWWDDQYSKPEPSKV